MEQQQGKPQAQVREETFEDYMRNARDAFVIAVKNEERSNYLLTAIDSFLICFDQMREKLTSSIPTEVQKEENKSVDELAKEKYPDDINSDEYVYPNSAVKILQQQAFKAGFLAASPKGKDTSGMQEKLSTLRDELYNEIPSGQIEDFTLILIISKHIRQLDALLEEYPSAPLLYTQQGEDATG